MTALSSANPCWPPPPVGRPRRARRRVGETVIENAVENAGTTTNDDTTRAPRRWFQHPLVTLGAFIVFPPLGLWFAIRHQGVWRQGLAVRIAVIAVTVAFVCRSSSTPAATPGPTSKTAHPSSATLSPHPRPRRTPPVQPQSRPLSNRPPPRKRPPRLSDGHTGPSRPTPAPRSGE